MADRKTYLYCISFENSKYVYIGITYNLEQRRRAHKAHANSRRKIPLYDAIRKHDKFFMDVIGVYATRKEACAAEQGIIALLRSLNCPLLNLAKGGEGGWVITDVEGWREKLKAARKGKKPSKGMQHTSENKKLFSKVSRKYWDSQDTYKPEEILKYSHREAKDLFGISTTHYYRLRNKFKEEE